MRTNLLPLRALSLTDIQHVVDPVLRGEATVDSIDEFVASVDWSWPEQADPGVSQLVGRIEALATEFAEGDIPQDTYFDLLRQALHPLSTR